MASNLSHRGTNLVTLANGYSMAPHQQHEINACCAAALDMRKKQAELLERKYGGGTMETSQAAQIIQSSFKQYSFSKNFERLRNTHDELRVQRLLLTDISSDRDSVWSDVVVTSHPSSPHRPLAVSISQSPSGSREDSVDFSSSPPSPDSFQTPDVDDDSLSYVKSHSASDSHLLDIQLKYNSCSGRSRKRQYRIGLNLFNRKPEQGIRYLMEQRFLANSSRAVAEFLIGRKGLSRQMIGEYIGNLRTKFNQDVLSCMIQHIDLTGLELDQALRKLIHLFRLPGESQKIERVMERFAQWYRICNPTFAERFHTVDSIFLLSYAIIMVNTDLHNSSIKPASKMKLEAFIRNLRGIDGGKDIHTDMLVRIYNRILKSELKVGPDHVSQVRKVERTMVGKIPNLAIPERRLVCYCRLYELSDPNRKEKLHQREIFLFNDILVITKIYAKKKDTITYTYKQSILINDVIVQCFTTEHYQYGIKLVSGQNRSTLICFNARNSHDRDKFVDDLIDSIAELKEMAMIQSASSHESRKRSLVTRSRMSKDSGVGDLETGRASVALPRNPPPAALAPPRDCAEQTRSVSLTQLDRGFINSQHSRRSESHVISGKSYHV